ncbi:MAG: PD-(D/E)XK nuclease family protein [Candidatus Firestonebacteria bacterium]|nr:PD-(D/E)XK nuclease family protein [Candidatus Firestonebacteria bacterium]
MLTIYCCTFSAYSGRTATEEVLSKIAENGKKVLYISPSGRKVEEVKAKNSNKDWGYFSLDRFVEKTLESVRVGRYIDDRFKLLLTLELLSQEVKYSTLFSNAPGTLAVITDLITDFKYYGYGKNTPDLKKKLREILFTNDKVSERAVFAAEIFEKYQQALKKHGFADDIDRMEQAGKIIGEKNTGYDTLVLDGFFDIPEGQKSFFTSLLNSSKQTIIIHYCDARIEEIKYIKSGFFDFVSSFNRSEIKKIEPAAKSRDVQCLRARKELSIEEEVSGIAEKILNLQNRGVANEDILVVFPSMFTYVPYIRRIFPKYKLPFSVSVDIAFCALPQVAPVVFLLKSIMDDYPRRTVVDIITSKSYRVFNKSARELISLASRKAGIVNGLNQWRDLEDRLKNEEPEFSEKYFAAVKLLRKDLELFFTAAEQLNRILTPKEFTSKFRKVLKVLGFTVKDALINKEFEKLLINIENDLEVLKGGKNKPEENIRLLLSVLQKAVFKEERKTDNSVRVLGVLDTRGLFCRHLFFGGLCDGEFPLRPKQEMILPDKTRKELKLIDFQRRIELQKLHFHRLLSAPEDEVYLSFPGQKDGKLVLPSNFLPEITGDEENTKTTGLTEEERQVGAGKKEGKAVSFFNTISFADNRKTEKYIRSALTGKTEIGVTAIDRYLNCPFTFYIENILGLEILEEPRFEVESAKIGTILHEVMEEAFKPGKKDKESLEEKITGAVEARLKIAALHDYWKEHIRRRTAALLKRLVKEERIICAEYPEVYCVEKKGRLKLPGVNMNVKGRIDRVDCNSGEYLIIDYKSGSGARNYFEKTKKGESIQLALYAGMIAEENKNLKPGGLCVYDLKEGKARMVKKEKLQELCDNSIDLTVKAVRAILNGDFPKKEKESGACYFCPYTAACRKTR